MPYIDHIRIVSIAHIDGKDLTCNGEITINNIQEPQAYVTWKLLSDDTLIASVSSNFYYKESLHNLDSLLNRVLEKIDNYRIGRNKIFRDARLIKHETNNN
ncbi:hypothetical protein P1X16_11385 [Hymenobacter sp. YC55]|nr:hypothetical protein [Hymenobacter sp. YC55]